MSAEVKNKYPLGTRYWWLNEESERVLNGGYLLKGETVEGAVNRVVNSAASRLHRPELAPVFKEIVEKGWMSLSSPIWANMGTERGLPISCNGVYIPDSIVGFTGKLGEVIMQTKHGAGTSVYSGAMRGRGESVTDNGSSSGAVSFLRMFDTTMDTISQGGVRRGALAAYLDIDHPDVAEFLTIKDIGSPIQNLFTGLCVPDYWLREMEAGDMEKRGIWAKVLESRQQKGLPYLFFSDNVNRNKPKWFIDKGMKIHASNLCVSGDTRILTKFGYFPIQELVGTSVDVWNGEEWSQVDVVKTGENQELLRVRTDSGYELDCTPYHKFYVQKGYNKGTGLNKLEISEVRACDLKVGDRLIKFDLPIVQGSNDLKFAYTNGFYSGDGCLTKNGQRIYLYSDKQLLAPHIEGVDKWFVDSNQNRMYGYSSGLKDKFFVPDATYTIESRLMWLSGYLDADGTVTNNNGSQSIQVASVELSFLQDVQLMLQTMGCDSKITLARIEGDYLLPRNDGSGDYSKYSCKTIYRLLINGNSLYKLSQLGLNCHRLMWEVKRPNRECSQFVKIESVDSLDGLHDTFCFTEHKRHMGMFNGILTGQCSEIALPSSADESFVCCLSSMNLELYEEWKDTDVVKMAIYFLDAVMEEYIEKTLGIPYMEASHNFAKNHRALGLGVLGWHSFLQRKHIPFDGLQAEMYNEVIFKHIRAQADEATRELAEYYGESPVTEGYGVRNSTLLAIAPTTSSSAILGQVSPGIEPFSSNYYKAGLAKGNFMRKNKYLQKLLDEKGINTEETWRQIMLDGGSVRNVQGLSQNDKDVFKTFEEVSQMSIINQAAARQKYIDQAQSINLNIPPSVPVKEVNQLYLTAWKKGVKTLYYQRSKSVAKDLVTNLVTCTSCEA